MKKRIVEGKAKQLEKHNPGFVKMTRSPEIEELIEEAPMAFTLAAKIALRARFKPGFSLKGLAQGEAFLGDHDRCGMSRQQYRTAIRQLEKWQFATFKPTNRGTVGKLMDTRLFDVLNNSANQQSNHQPTISQPLTKNGKNGKNGKECRETGFLQNPFSQFSESEPDDRLPAHQQMEQPKVSIGEYPPIHFAALPSSVAEVVQFAMTRNDFKTSDVQKWLARFDFNRQAVAILAKLTDHDEVRETLECVFRFLHYNNRAGWKIEKSWRSAFLGFKENCDYGSDYGNGVADTPLAWVPHIAGLDGWPDEVESLEEKEI